MITHVITNNHQNIPCFSQQISNCHRTYMYNRISLGQFKYLLTFDIHSTAA